VGCLLQGQALATGQTTIARVSTGSIAAVTSSAVLPPTTESSQPASPTSQSRSSTSQSATPSPSGSGGEGGCGGGGSGLNTIQTVFTVLGTVIGALALGVSVYECRNGGSFRRNQPTGHGAAATSPGQHNMFNMRPL
jgi:hypothetical protein